MTSPTILLTLWLGDGWAFLLDEADTCRACQSSHFIFINRNGSTRCSYCAWNEKEAA